MMAESNQKKGNIYDLSLWNWISSAKNKKNKELKEI